MIRPLLIIQGDFMKRIFASVFALLFFTACGSSDDQQLQLNNELAHFKGAGAMGFATFGGTYTSECVALNVSGTTLYEIESLRILSQIDRTPTDIHHPMSYSYTYTEQSTLYQDSECISPITREDARGNHEFGSNGIQITFKPTLYQITPKSNIGVEALNGVKACGESNWKIDHAKEISNLSCFSNYSTQYAYLNLLDNSSKKIEMYFCKSAGDLPSTCLRVPMSKN